MCITSCRLVVRPFQSRSYIIFFVLCGAQGHALTLSVLGAQVRNTHALERLPPRLKEVALSAKDASEGYAPECFEVTRSLCVCWLAAGAESEPVDAPLNMASRHGCSSCSCSCSCCCSCSCSGACCLSTLNVCRPRCGSQWKRSTQSTVRSMHSWRSFLPIPTSTGRWCVVSHSTGSARCNDAHRDRFAT